MKWSESIQNDLCKIWEKVSILIIYFLLLYVYVQGDTWEAKGF